MAKDWHHKTHGLSKTPIYRLWWGMVSRCTHPKTKGFAAYSTLETPICKEWLSFENFYADMGDRPEGMTIERIDNDKGYSKENCRWATVKEQNRNKDTNVLVDWNGETFVQIDLCKQLNIYPTHIPRLLKRGFSRVGAIEHLVKLQENRRCQNLLNGS